MQNVNQINNTVTMGPIQPTKSLSARLLGYAPWITLAGTSMLLVGLGWDGVLHSLDPELAEKEGIFTLVNPGHLLFAGGIAVIVLGILFFLVGKAKETKQISKMKKIGYVATIAGLIVLAIGSFAIASASGSGLTGDHHHEADGTASGAGTNPVADAGHNHSSTQPTVGTTPGHSHSADSATTAVTPEQQAAADKLLSEVKAGTVRFNDFKTAESEGYKQITPYINGKFGPAHFHNARYAADGKTLDPTKPEDLVYLKMANGKMVYLGAMFLAAPGTGPAPGGSLTMWHTHDNLCIGKNTVKAKGASGTCPAGTVAIQQEMMHVWTFDNPDGPFAHELTKEALLAAAKQTSQK